MTVLGQNPLNYLMKAPDPARDTQVLTFCFTWFVSLFFSSLEGECTPAAVEQFHQYVLMASLWLLTGFVRWIFKTEESHETGNKNNELSFAKANSATK
jgi:hypothetical protein